MKVTYFTLFLVFIKICLNSTTSI